MYRLLLLTLTFSIAVGSVAAVLGVPTQSPTLQSDFRQDYAYHAAVDGWMKLHRSPATWVQARLRCQAEGSILASPLDEALQTTMEAVMGQKARSIFTGISSNIVKDEFLSVEGVSLDDIPSSWVNTEPGKEQCIAMYNNGALGDISCNERRPYICYKQNSLTGAQTSRCGTSDTYYIHKVETGHCYKFHRNGRIWADAYKTCIIEGGYLAVINSDEEAKVLRGMMHDNPSKLIVAKERSMVAIGYRDWSNHQLWMTIHGETLEQAGYHNWGKKQPDNLTSLSKSGEYCGAIATTGGDGLLHDIGCDITVPFICEMDPVSELEPRMASISFPEDNEK